MIFIFISLGFVAVPSHRKIASLSVTLLTDLDNKKKSSTKLDRRVNSFCAVLCSLIKILSCVVSLAKMRWKGRDLTVPIETYKYGDYRSSQMVSENLWYYRNIGCVCLDASHFPMLVRIFNIIIQPWAVLTCYCIWCDEYRRKTHIIFQKHFISHFSR